VHGVYNQVVSKPDETANGTVVSKNERFTGFNAKLGNPKNLHALGIDWSIVRVNSVIVAHENSQSGHLRCAR